MSQSLVVYGTYSMPKAADEEVVELCIEVRLDVQKITEKKYKLFTPVLYREEDVDPGKNFLIKVHVGEKNYIHIKVNQDNGPNEVVNIEENHTKEDPLNNF
ncbi:leukocyte cysteine proteinase inhibitor 1-like [Halichoeres trimaculatus]|uniref:leukocyte cysteine proteinase inhibitor 1-like n=1 Tax=Halichoeres trimaculatus TaxID=147232 RepID=UPI003D9E1AF3